MTQSAPSAAAHDLAAADPLPDRTPPASPLPEAARPEPDVLVIGRGPAWESALQRDMARRLTRGLNRFQWCIDRFTTPVMPPLFNHPRNHWPLEQAVISMPAGDVFDHRAALRRLRVVRALHALSALRMAATALRGGLRRRPRVRIAVSGATLQAGTP